MLLPTVGKFIKKGAPVVGKFIKKHGRVVGNFLKENAGNLLATGANLAAEHYGKKEWLDKAKDKLKAAADISKAMYGEDSKIGTQLKNLSDVVKGENIKWNHVKSDNDNINNTALAFPNQLSNFYYNKNLGGTNFKRHKKRRRPKHKK